MTTLFCSKCKIYTSLYSSLRETETHRRSWQKYL